MDQCGCKNQQKQQNGCSEAHAGKSSADTLNSPLKVDGHQATYQHGNLFAALRKMTLLIFKVWF